MQNVLMFVWFVALQEVSASSTSSDSGSDVNDNKPGNAKRKFKKVAVTWP